MKKFLKFLDKVRKAYKELDSYDRVFFEGKLMSCLIVVLCAILILLTILVCIM